MTVGRWRVIIILTKIVGIDFVRIKVVGINFSLGDEERYEIIY